MHAGEKRQEPEQCARILVIEDNPKMASAIQSGLRDRGFTVDAVHAGQEGEDTAADGNYDLILLDLMLPDRDGMEVCRSLRHRGVTAGILMVTALSSMDDKVGGLDSGADDFLTKPFEFEELLARIRALLRRGQTQEERFLRYDGLALDLHTRTAEREGSSTELSNKEFALLEFLMRHPDRALSREQICAKVWDINFEPSSNVVDTYISALRKKIDRGHGEELIHTVTGVGYRFGAAVSP